MRIEGIITLIILIMEAKMVSPVSNQGPQNVDPSAQQKSLVQPNSISNQPVVPHTNSNHVKRFAALRRAHMAQTNIQRATIQTTDTHAAAATSSTLLSQAKQEVARAAADLASAQSALQSTGFTVYSQVIVPQATLAYNLAVQAKKLAKSAKTAKQKKAAQAALTKAINASVKTESQLAIPPAATTALTQANQVVTNASYFQTSSNPLDQQVYNQLVTAKNAISTARTTINNATTETSLNTGKTAMDQGQTLLTTAIQAVNARVPMAKVDLLASAQSSATQASQALLMSDYYLNSSNAQDNLVYTQLLTASNSLTSAIALVNQVNDLVTLATANTAVKNAQAALATAIQAIANQFALDKASMINLATQHNNIAQTELVNDIFFQYDLYSGDFPVYNLVQQCAFSAENVFNIANGINDTNTLQVAKDMYNNSLAELASAQAAVATQIIADKTTLADVISTAHSQALQFQNTLVTYFTPPKTPEDQAVATQASAAINRVLAALQQVITLNSAVSLNDAHFEVWLAKTDLMNATNAIVSQGLTDSNILKTQIQLILDDPSTTGDVSNIANFAMTYAGYATIGFQSFIDLAAGTDVFTFPDIFAGGWAGNAELAFTNLKIAYDTYLSISG